MCLISLNSIFFNDLIEHFDSLIAHDMFGFSLSKKRDLNSEKSI